MIETRLSGTYYLRNISSYNLGKVAGKVELSNLQIVVHPNTNQNLTPNQTLSLLNFIIVYLFSFNYLTYCYCLFNNMEQFDTFSEYINLTTFFFISSPK